MNHIDEIINIAQSDATRLKGTVTPAAAGKQTVVQDDAAKLKATNTPAAGSTLTIKQPDPSKLKITVTPSGTLIVERKKAAGLTSYHAILPIDGAGTYVTAAHDTPGQTVAIWTVKNPDTCDTLLEVSPDGVEWCNTLHNVAVGAGFNIYFVPVGTPYVRFKVVNAAAWTGNVEMYLFLFPNRYYDAMWP